MGPLGAGDAHKLPGIAGSKNISKGPDRIVSVATIGQPDSCSICQQHGGTVSPQLTDLVKALWMWALSNDIVLTAEYITGVMNVVADAESRSMTQTWGKHLCL